MRAELRTRTGLAPAGYTRGGGRWQVSYFRDRAELVQVYVGDADGRVLEVWTGPQVAWEMARGYPGAFGRKINSPWVWIPLCLAFLAPFVDPRRPFRLLHLDLLVLLSFSVSHLFFNRGEISASVPLVYPVLAYLFVRMVVAGLRPRPGRGPLIPLAPLGALVLALVFLVGLWVALNVVDSNVIDVGYAGVIGADKIADREPLYEGAFPADNRTGDTYGPAAYITYLPFEQALPWSGRWDSLPAAHAAAVAFDLLTMAGLFLLGRRARAGPAGLTLGVALAYAWAAYPYTLFVLQSNSNDALVAVSVVWALVAVSSPPARGALVALGALAKFAPLAVAPVFATGTGEHRLRSIALFGAAFAGVTVLCVQPFVPDGGLAELYDRTLGAQIGRKSPFSVWGMFEWTKPGQLIAQAAAVTLGVGVAFVPRRRTPAQVAALAASVLLLVEAGATHWFYLYVVWFAPLTLFALFSAHGTGPEPEAPAEAGRLRRRSAVPG